MISKTQITAPMVICIFWITELGEENRLLTFLADEDNIFSYISRMLQYSTNIIWTLLCCSGIGNKKFWNLQKETFYCGDILENHAPIGNVEKETSLEFSKGSHFINNNYNNIFPIENFCFH